jgi:hypothetical protein
MRLAVHHDQPVGIERLLAKRERTTGLRREPKPRETPRETSERYGWF